MKNPLALVCRTCAAGAIALFLSANASAGAIFHGTFDPSLYGGSVFIDLPDPGCITADGFIATGTVTCGDVVITSLVVQHPNVGTPDDTLTFGTPISGEVRGLWWVGGTLEAIDTFALFAPPSGGSFFTAAGYELIFESGHDPDLSPSPSDVLLLACSNTGCDGGERTLVGSEAATQQGFVQVVPEPGSIALIFGGLGAAWLVRRRRGTDYSLFLNAHPARKFGRRKAKKVRAQNPGIQAALLSP